jgi:tetratricopeptide (TPR) repeat protein
MSAPPRSLAAAAVVFTSALFAASCMGACAGGRQLRATGPGVRAGQIGGTTTRPGELIADPTRVPAVAVAPPEPVPTDLAGADAALARGSYTAAGQAYAALAGTLTGAEQAKATLGVARVRWETGDYAGATEAAERASRDAALRVVATTLRAETLIARGKLDDAEQLLTPLASEPDAHRAHLVLGRLLVSRGRKTEAEPQLMSLVQAFNADRITDGDAEGLMLVALAARALGSYQDANDAFQSSARADPRRVETQLEWAELFLEKYDAGHAEDCVRDALAVNPKSPRAHALLARIALEQGFDFEKARRECELAQAIDPSLVSCHVTRAGMALRDMDLAGADAHLRRALAVDAQDLEALSVSAAVRFLADDAAGFERVKAEVLRRNRSFSRFYSIVGDYAEWEHRYPEIVRMAREALTLDPEDAFAHATLGMNLLRMGDEVGGLAALREAWRRDRFNVHVYNTLNLYDDVIARDYEDVPAAPFVFRFEREERASLEPYVVPVLRGAYADMVRRYRFTPEGPVRLEMFANPQHFSVRTTGLPNVGVQGVCFGKVVTAISPRGGPFNWGNITWHELAHVFHIQLSRNHVPRWFTEGLAEYETIVARPEWKREDDMALWLALDSGRLPAIRDLNGAFTHAERPEDVLTAYYASSMVVVYLIGRFGFDKVPAMLSAWGEGEQTPEVIQSVLGLSVEDLDRDFRAFTRTRLAPRAAEFVVDLGRYRDLPALRTASAAAPRDAHATAALAAGLLVSGDAQEGKRAAEAALALDAHEPTAHYLLAELAMGGDDARGADAHLRDLLASRHDGYDVRTLAARVSLALRDRPAAIAHLEAATAIDAERPDAWQGLRQLSREGHDAARLTTALERLANIDQHDRANYAELLTVLADANRWSDLVRFGESAVFVEPGRAETHRLLGEAYVRTGKAREGLVELDQTLRLRPDRPGLVQLGRARALVALRRLPEARRAADEATRADASLAAEAQGILAGR